MGTVYRDVYLSVNNVDISDTVKSLTIEDTTDEIEMTANGDNYKKFEAGLSDAKITAELYQDYESQGVHATLSALKRNKSEFPVVVRPKNEPSSETNPEFHLTAKLLNYNPLAMTGPSEAGMVTAEFRNASSSGLVEVQGETTVS